MNVKILCEFLVKAKRATYASGEVADKIVEIDKSTSLTFAERDLKYHDNYFGGEPFGGREVVFENNNPVYIMTYYGFVDESVADFGAVYQVLQKALSLIPVEHPYRGPSEFVDGDFVYRNQFVGEVENFSGEETITFQGKEVFTTKYIGGLVDKRKE